MNRQLAAFYAFYVLKNGTNTNSNLKLNRSHGWINNFLKNITLYNTTQSLANMFQSVQTNPRYKLMAKRNCSYLVWKNPIAPYACHYQLRRILSQLVVAAVLFQEGHLNVWSSQILQRTNLRSKPPQSSTINSDEFKIKMNRVAARFHETTPENSLHFHKSKEPKR